MKIKCSEPEVENRHNFIFKTEAVDEKTCSHDYSVSSEWNLMKNKNTSVVSADPAQWPDRGPVPHFEATKWYYCFFWEWLTKCS